MTTINIVSSADESSLKKTLSNILSSNQKYQYVNIFQSNDLDTGDIIIFGSKIIPYNYNIKSNDKIFIVSEDNRDALNFLHCNGNTAICCGMTTGNSVSISSMSTNSAVVSILRELISLRGEPIGPLDIPVQTFPDDEPYSIMASVVVSLII